MIHQWLDVGFAAFRRTHYTRTPFAQPHTARAAVPLLTWDTLYRMLPSAAPDTLVVRNGALLDRDVPRDGEAFREMFGAGCSVVIRRAEDHDAGMAAVARAVGQHFRGKVTIHVFVTPAGYHSFGWHYDCEDVFIAQTAGRKEYLLRQNTVNPRPCPATMPRDLQFEKETSPTAACTLIPSDWIYIPSGWWHVARCAEDSLSMSIGILRPEVARQAA